METRGVFIDGRERSSADQSTVEVEDPAAGRAWLRVAEAGRDDVEVAVAAAERAFGDWSRRTVPERAGVLRHAADLVRERAEELAHEEVRDVGKPIADARAQISSVADVFDFYSGVVRHLHGETLPLGSGGLDYTLRQPIGVAGLITPWNFPTLIAAWKLAPALAAGNTVVHKPALLTPTTAVRLAAILTEAGAPPGAVNVLPGRGSVVGQALVDDPRVRKIAFTGSTEVGKGIQRGAADQLKRVTLELGGKSPSLVFADADLEKAAESGVSAVFEVAGQDCCARSRVLVQESVHDEFVDALVAATKAWRVGSPADPDTQMGPLITADQRESVLSYIASARDEGAVVFGGEPFDGPGHFMSPAVVDRTERGMRVVEEEIFGPVVSVLTFADEAEAVELGNHTNYGLSASVWTRDIARAHRCARDLQAGVVSVNSNTSVHTGAPFGGWKHSGYGREVGAEALRYYTELKNVYVELDD